MKLNDFLLLLFLLILLFLNLALGEVNLSVNDLYAIFSGSSSEINNTLVFDLRLPRMMSAFLVGGSLSVCGLYFQSLLKNPLAEPFTMGYSGAAALGVSIAISFGFRDGFIGPSLLGLIFCCLVALITIHIKNKFFLKSHVGLILIGLSIGFFASSMVVLLQGSLNPEELHLSYQWLIGSFDNFRTKLWPILLIPSALLAIFQITHSKKLNICLLGENTARSMGVNKKNIDSKVLVLAALVCGSSVYISGVIAFVGLVAPHITKKLYKTNLHDILFLRSFICGSIILLLSDLIAKLLSQSFTVPTGGVVSLIGAPFLVFLLLKDKQYA